MIVLFYWGWLDNYYIAGTAIFLGVVLLYYWLRSKRAGKSGSKD